MRSYATFVLQLGMAAVKLFRQWIKLCTLAGLLACMNLLSGCVSVNFGPKKPEHSKGVEFSPPGNPFQAIVGKADRAWQNKENGNSISFLSSCDDPADPALDIVMQDLFADMKDLKVLKSENTTFNGRASLSSEVEGMVDGVPTRVHAVVFKKNNCLYTLSYIGVAKAYGQDRDRFEQFLKGFKAP